MRLFKRKKLPEPVTLSNDKVMELFEKAFLKVANDPERKAALRIPTTGHVLRDMILIFSKR